jgi:alpha-N-arabinofuranosidase
VQKLFSNNQGSELINITHNGNPLTGQNNIYASAMLDSKQKQLIIKLVNTSKDTQKIAFNIPNLRIKPTATINYLSAATLDSENSFASPQNITLNTKTEKIKKNKMEITAMAHSVSVVKLELQQ